MTSTINARSRMATSLSGMLLTFLVVLFTTGAAKAEAPAKVIAHVTLPGTAVRQMFLQQVDGKQYLYLQQTAHFTVVDVSDPKNPKLVERVASRGSLQSVGAGLALTVAPEKATTSEQANTVPTQVVNVMDLSDPKHPRSIRTFNGVTSLLPDDARKLVFVANNEGLWVLSHNQPSRLPLCTSEDAMNPNPDCQ